MRPEICPPGDQPAAGFEVVPKARRPGNSVAYLLSLRANVQSQFHEQTIAEPFTMPPFHPACKTMRRRKSKSSPPTSGLTPSPLWSVPLCRFGSSCSPSCSISLWVVGGLNGHSGWFAQPGLWSFQFHRFQTGGLPAEIRRGSGEWRAGKVVYEQVCGICHGVDGLGKPGLAPPWLL